MRQKIGKHFLTSVRRAYAILRITVVSRIAANTRQLKLQGIKLVIPFHSKANQVLVVVGNKTSIPDLLWLPNPLAVTVIEYLAGGI